MSRRSALVFCHCGIPGCSHCEETKSFNSAVRLFAVNSRVDEENDAFLASTGNPVARIVATNTHAMGASFKGSGLYQALKLSIGCRVMLRRNIAVELGLVNGSLGTVQAIVYEEGAVPPALPLYVLVKFDSYRGPCLINDLFPIVPISESSQQILERGQTRQSNTRKQLPLSVAHAITVVF